jgi:glycerol uptake operon antiterminator
VFVHIDLIDGLASRDVAVDYIAKNTKADGIISTRPNIVKCAKTYDLLTIQRFFVLDSIALNNIGKQLSNAADAIEILPGVMPKIIKILATCTEKPIIAGGLIIDKEDVVNALNAGASAISSSNENIWKQ